MAKQFTRVAKDIAIAVHAGGPDPAGNPTLRRVLQNARAVNISFLGAHLRLSLAVALLLATIAGALIMAAAGTARITQLRQIIRRDRRKSRTS